MQSKILLWIKGWERAWLLPVDAKLLGAFEVYLRMQCSDDHEMCISPMVIDMSAISGFNSKSILYLFY